MRRSSSVVGLAFWACWAPGCSANHSDCDCSVVSGGERRVVACGAVACVGGTSLSCADQDVIVPGGACTAALPATGMPGAGSSAPEPPPEPSGEPDESCAELASFCGSQCTTPDNVAADCQATASAGDASACATWALAEGALCQ